MGDKYIIELEEKPFHDDNGDFLYRVKGFNSLVFDMTGIGKLTPYTEPDLEQVRKEAYDEGYADAKGGYENGFENGMIVAWDVARKLEFGTDKGGIPTDTIAEIFGTPIPNRVLRDFTASEAIEKIRQYEQRQEEQIQVGDEVERILNGEVDSKAVFLEDNEGYYRCLFWTGCCFTTLSYPKEQFRKTGRHFDEIASVLEKMRGEQDG